MTREEFESILEEAYIEGYNTAIEDIQEDILDEEAYDLENEYEYYTEANHDSKITRVGKALMRGGDEVAKELGVSKGTRKNIAKVGMNLIGNANPKLRAKLLAKNASHALTSLAKDRDRIRRNVQDTVGSAAMKAAELAPHKNQIEQDAKKYNLDLKSNIVKRLANSASGTAEKVFKTLQGKNGPHSRHSVDDIRTIKKDDYYNPRNSHFRKSLKS